MITKITRSALTIVMTIAMVAQPITYSYSQVISDDLSPCPVSASVQMTPGDGEFANSVIQDAQFLSFAIFAYKTVIHDGADAGILFAELAKLPFWKDFSFKSYLSKEFIAVKGDVLEIRLKDMDVIRVVSASTHRIGEDGSTEDGIVPKTFYITDGHLVQYITDASSPGKPAAGPQNMDGSAAPLNMIGFGPELSYNALEITSDLRGVYITAEEKRTEKPKIAVNVSELAGLGPLVAERLREHGLYTAAHVIQAGEDKLASFFGAETIARILEACRRPYYAKVISFDCLTEDGASERAKEVAEMMGQVFCILNNTKDSPGKDTEERRLAEILREKASRLIGRKIKVESAENLEANSASYNGTIVFNKHFIDFLFDRWVSHRRERTSAHWTEELGALMMLSERLFHEIDHDPDEVQQVLLDRLYFRATIKNRDILKDAVRYDVSFQAKANGGGRGASFGEFFGTNAYFAMIHRISEMNDLNEITRVIHEYLENVYRNISRKETLNLTAAQVAFAEKILREHGITDDLFGETIAGVGFDGFFREHCLFSEGYPYNYEEIDLEQRRRCSEIYKWNVGDIREHILAVGRSIGEEAQTARWMENRLRMRHIRGPGSVKKKLYPIIKWSAAVTDPQNFQIRRGRLFGRVHYRGLNLMTLPIFPAGDDGEIRWDLFRFDEGYSVWDASEGRNIIVRAPPRDYYKTKRISLYEYVITHAPEAKQALQAKETTYIQPTLFDVGGQPENDKKKETPKKKKKETPVRRPQERYIQGTLFSEDGPDYENGVTGDNFPPVARTGEYDDAIRRNISELHGYTAQIDVSPTIDKVTHILIARDIPADSQQDILIFLNKRSREALVAEKVYFMDPEDINAYIAANRCGKDNTVVLLSDQALIEKIKGDVNMLVIRKEGVTDFVNIEGLIGAARCVLNRDWDSFRGIYKALTGVECPEIRPEWLADPAELARQLVITLPPVSIIKVEEQKMLNEMLREALVAA